MTIGIIIALIVISIIALMAKGGKKIIEGYEAKLSPTNANDFAISGGGEVERELYGDGNAELKLQFTGTKIPDGSIVSLIINGSKVGDFQVSRGAVYEKIKTQTGATVHSVKAGDTVEVVFDGTSVLSGTFYLD